MNKLFDDQFRDSFPLILTPAETMVDVGGVKTQTCDHLNWGCLILGGWDYFTKCLYTLYIIYLCKYCIILYNTV